MEFCVVGWQGPLLFPSVTLLAEVHSAPPLLHSIRYIDLRVSCQGICLLHSLGLNVANKRFLLQHLVIEPLTCKSTSDCYPLRMELVLEDITHFFNCAIMIVLPGPLTVLTMSSANSPNQDTFCDKIGFMTGSEIECFWPLSITSECHTDHLVN